MKMSVGGEHRDKYLVDKVMRGIECCARELEQELDEKW